MIMISCWPHWLSLMMLFYCMHCIENGAYNYNSQIIIMFLSPNWPPLLPTHVWLGWWNCETLELRLMGYFLFQDHYLLQSAKNIIIVKAGGLFVKSVRVTTHRAHLILVVMVANFPTEYCSKYTTSLSITEVIHLQSSKRFQHSTLTLLMSFPSLLLKHWQTK